MKHYEEEGFEIAYEQHLKELDKFLKKTKECESTYFDPDLGDKKEFYDNLITFLNDSCKNKNFEFESNGKKLKIKNETLDLTSDQFGFTAPRCESNEIKGCNLIHPYYKYLALSNEEDKCKIIASWINDTRTIGGSFIWPISESGSSKYNANRGGGFIEDTVDLTLLEVKHFYDIYKPNSSKEQVIERYNHDYSGAEGRWKSGAQLFVNSSEQIKMYDWLNHFSSFKDYVDFFKFNDFVNESYDEIIDIFNSKLDANNKDNDIKCYLNNQIFSKEFSDKCFDYKSGRIKNIELIVKNGGNELIKKTTIDDIKVEFKLADNDYDRIAAEILKRMLENVRTLIVRRSQEIEK